MSDIDVRAELAHWIENVQDADLAAELADMLAKADAGDDAAMTDAFFQNLSFGTAGLRGVLGAGTNRMNIYTVGRATQGFADYLNANFDNPSVAIARDSRNNGELFVRTTAAIMAANGVTAYVYPRISPVPTLSWAVRDLGCSGGICMTASHNPAPYNGYKAYGPDGCQITSQAAAAISAAIAGTDAFTGVKSMDFDEAVASGKVKWIEDAVLERYYDAVLAQSVNNLSDEQIAAAPLKLVYTPLNGTGLVPVTTVLARAGVSDVTVVPEQEQPDGNFPTCPYPNPEIREAMQKGIDLCEQVHPDLLLATDPDADRVGIAMKCPDGSYELVSGNEMGALLLDYICAGRIEKGTMPKNPVAVKSIVSTPLADAIAAHYGVEMRSVLTGFKWIGDQIANLEAAGEVDRFIFGFEESYGYLAGPYVRDKDAVIGSMLICEMAAYYRSIGSSIKQRLEEIYKQYGRYLNKVDSFEFPGLTGMEKMASIMQKLRDDPPAELAGHKVVKVTDYKKPEETGLPAANVLIYSLENGATVVVRPSGTEPKIKTYFTTLGKDLAEAQAQKDALAAAIEPILK